jgi:hypothetical protein
MNGRSIELFRFAPNNNKDIFGALLLITNGYIKDLIPVMENDNLEIKKGTYNIMVTPSPKFNRNLPLIITENRSGIRIHHGTISEGCLLTKTKNDEITVKRFIRERTLKLTVYEL